ncbi:MAG TPA: rubrerythrin family protein [Ignavibacteriales bacterium]|nr:rubrerythrin family protein [Ignavibacteriales bacterium]HOL81519.1 rubrerythrin family protein [Ignavibacteriales bacterium]HPD67046.1 rubrerythrin family protein [Ignavibacteriales bacterium]HPP33554.1 rubrerythrin family protein [Ignavibacteriales bacterium]HRR19482.1 rubrerythrin family protein [Ignavibacteriales bacterium]
MKSIKGTKTEKNLLAAFAGESQARNRYNLFAEKARKEGFVAVADVFDATALNEYEHAKIFFKYLEGGDVEINASYPAGKVKSTYDNLLMAASGENHEYEVLYPEFAKVAKEEGFPEIASMFKLIAKIEKHHQERFAALAEHIKNSTLYRKTEKVKWLCLKCGHIHEGERAPEHCPVCNEDRAYFKLVNEVF